MWDISNSRNRQRWRLSCLLPYISSWQWRSFRSGLWNSVTICPIHCSTMAVNRSYWRDWSMDDLPKERFFLGSFQDRILDDLAVGQHTQERVRDLRRIQFLGHFYQREIFFIRFADPDWSDTQVWSVIIASSRPFPCWILPTRHVAIDDDHCSGKGLAGVY